MPRLPNPVQVGRMACPGCDSRIPVYINKRGYFYTKCAECGTDQRNGKAIQTHIYLSTDWMGETPPPPRCVDPADLVQEPESTEPEPAPEPENLPVPTEPEPAPAPAQNRKTPGVFGPAFALGFALPLIIIGVMP